MLGQSKCKVVQLQCTACSNDYGKVTTSIKACFKPQPKIGTLTFILKVGTSSDEGYQVVTTSNHQKTSSNHYVTSINHQVTSKKIKVTDK